MTAKIKLNAASGGGSFSLQAPSSSANNRVFTIPDEADATLLTSNTSTGKILQVLETTRLDASSHTVNAGADFNPTFLRQSITTTGSNKVIVEGFLTCALDVGTNWIGIGLRRDNSDITASLGVASGNKKKVSSASFNNGDDNLTSIVFNFLDSPGAGTHEYHLQIYHGSGGNRTLYVNRSENDPNSASGCRTGSIIRCMEVAA